MQRTRAPSPCIPEGDFDVRHALRGSCLYWETQKNQGKICYIDPETKEQQHPIHVHAKGLCSPLQYLTPTHEYIFWLVPGHNNICWPQAWNVQIYDDAKHGIIASTKKNFDTLDLTDLTSNFPSLKTALPSPNMRSAADPATASKSSVDITKSDPSDGALAPNSKKIETADATDKDKDKDKYGEALAPEHQKVSDALDCVKTEVMKVLTSFPSLTSCHHVMQAQQAQIDAQKADIEQLRANLTVLLETTFDNSQKISKLENAKLQLMAHSLKS